MNATACGCECPYTDATFLRGVCGPALAVFLGIVEMMLRERCDIVQPCHRGQPDAYARRGQQDFDYVVVGAGVAGSVVAARLSEDTGRSVLLLEAGPEEPLGTMVPAFAFNSRDTHLDWRFETEVERRACKNRGGRCKWPRGKMVAGTGGMQGMMYMRGSPAVFDAWERLGNPGWGYRDVLRYFLRAEGNRQMQLVEREFHSDKGPLAVEHFKHRPQLADDIVRAGNQLLGRNKTPKDLNGRNQVGFVVAQMMQYEGLRGSTARMYLRPAMGRPNLVVNTFAHVTKIAIDTTRSRAVAVEFVDKQGKKQRVRVKKEVVVSAGAVGSPHLLLLSGLGPTEDLEAVGVKPVADLPVGRNLHNHVAGSVNYVIDDRAGRRRGGADDQEEEVDGDGPMSMAALLKYMDKRSGPMASTGLTQVTGFVTTKFAEPGVPDVQYFFDGLNAGCESELTPSLTCTGPNATKSRANYYDIDVDLDLDESARKAAHTGVQLGMAKAHNDSNVLVEECTMLRRVAARPTVLAVFSRGRISLRSANPFDPPKIAANYFSHERDLLVLVEGMKMAAKLPQMPALKRWGFRLDTTPVSGCEHLPFASDMYWRCSAMVDTRPENHQTGSCRMGPAGDHRAVVDPELRVHGVPNLRVADASIMPIVPNANPISSIVMIAEKAADMIKATWSHKAPWE